MIDDGRLLKVLRDTFGHSDFRPHQRPIIDAILHGRSVLGVLPTGGGKSLCYQLPSMLLPGATLVISPLIALMKDQIDGLPPDLHAQATVLNSSLDFDEVKRREQAVASGRLRLIYAAPERLRQQGFLDLLRRINLSMVVVDEAHCVSVWGHDFRPDYLFIRKALDHLAQPQSSSSSSSSSSSAVSQAQNGATLLALTATATPEMQAEIAQQLGRELDVVAAPTYRPNLNFEVFHCANNDEKLALLLKTCRETYGSSIVYTRSREKAEDIAAFLRRRKVQAEFYHAGMDRESRRQVQERFMLDRTRVIVATIAFGMGIDKANVRLVAHFQLPESLESYTQEAGRAGRDGRPSRCVMFYSSSDKATLSTWLKREAVKLEDARDVYRAIKERIQAGRGIVSPDELQYQVYKNRPEGAETRVRVAISMMERAGMLIRHADAGRDLSIEIVNAPKESRTRLEELLEIRDRHAEQRLQEVNTYAAGAECRHAVISRHFGQPMERCGSSCDVCRGTAPPSKATKKVVFPPSPEKVPDVGRTILEALGSVDFPLGRPGIARLLAGAITSPLPRERSDYFGVMEGFTPTKIQSFINELIASGHLFLNGESEYYTLVITKKGQQALEGGEVILRNPVRPPHSVTRSPAVVIPNEVRNPLLPSESNPPPKSRFLGPRNDSQPSDTESEPTEDELDRFEKLRQWRRIIAHKSELPPYVVFHDSTLRAIAKLNPGSLKELAEVPGIGPNKLTAYGRQVINLLSGAADGIG